MKKILVTFILICVSVMMRAQYIEQPTTAAEDSTVVEYVEDNIKSEAPKPDAIVQIKYANYESYVQDIRLGQAEFAIGSTFLVTGITMAATPYIMANETGVKTGNEEGFYYTGAAFTVMGIIYISTGLTKWCRGSKKIKGVYMSYTPVSFSVNF